MKRTPKHTSLKLGFVLALAVVNTPPVEAQSAATPAAPESFSVDDNFRFGWHEVAVGGASFYANIVRGNNRPNLDYAMGYAQAGFMVTEPKGSSIFRGSFELVPEIFGGGHLPWPGKLHRRRHAVVPL